MKHFITPLQKNGRLILPSELRKTMGIAEGDKIVLRVDGDRVELTPARTHRLRAREIFRQHVPAGTPIVDEMIAERREEERAEEARCTEKAGNAE